MSDNNFPVYDEDEAINFIRESVDKAINERYSDDDIQEIIDAIWDYYDAQGTTSLNNIEDDEEEYPEPETVAKNILKVLSKNGPKAINLDDLTLIVKGEIGYEKYLDSNL